MPSQPADLELWFWDWLNVCKIEGYEKLGGKLYIEATDIDELCVCMTYTQLSLLGLSVRVIHGNSLSGEIFSTWDSPNLQMANLTGYFN